MLEPGLYEQVINKQIQSELQGTTEDIKYVEKIDGAEASEVLARYVSEIVHKALDRISEDGELTAKVDLVNKVVTCLYHLHSPVTLCMSSTMKDGSTGHALQNR